MPHHLEARCRASLIAALIIGGVSIPAALSRAQETVGNALVNRATIDTANGAIFVELHGFSQGGQLSSFAFYNDDPSTAGRQLTPLVFEQVGSDFVIRGVGSPVANAGTGAQTFPFTLQLGSPNVGPGFFFGYKNGADADPSALGVIEFDFISGASSERYFGTDHSNDLTPGANLGAGIFLGPNIGQVEREYSVTATSIPEPAALGMLACGALGMLAIRRRRAA